MKLEEFVKEALEAILHGVREAQSGYTGSAAAPPESDRMNPLGHEDIDSACVLNDKKRTPLSYTCGGCSA